MSSSKKISSDIFATTLLKISLKVRGLVFIPLLTVSLGVSEYGAYVQAMVVVTIFTNISTVGLQSGLVRYTPRTNDIATLYSTLMSVTLTVAAGIGTVVYAVSPVFSELFLSTGVYADAFAVSGVLIPLTTALWMAQHYFQARTRVKLYSISDAADVYLSVIGVIVAVTVFETGIVGALMAIAFSRATVVLGLNALIWRDVGFSLPRKTNLREYLSYGIPTMFTSFSQKLLTQFDRILLGFFIGASAVGIYNVAYQIAMIIWLFVQPLTISFFPEFSHLWEDDERERCRELAKSGIRYFMTLAIPSIAGFYLVAEDVILLLSTPDVASAGASLTVVLGLAVTFRGLASIYTKLFFAAEDTKTPMKVQMTTAALNIVLNLVAIPLFGILGAAFATVFSYAVSFGTIAGLFQRILRVIPPLSYLGKSIIAAVTMVAGVSVLGLKHIAVVIPLAAGIYFGVLFTTGGITTTEFKLLTQSLR